MSGRISGELWSRDFGLGLVLIHRPHARYRWSLTAHVFRTSFTVSFVRDRWAH